MQTTPVAQSTCGSQDEKIQLSREDVIKTIDKEVEILVEANKQIGLTKWGLIVALGGLLLMAGRMWEVGGTGFGDVVYLLTNIPLFAILTPCHEPPV